MLEYEYDKTTDNQEVDDMKAKVFFKDEQNKSRQKTIEVVKNEPNEIVREFIKATGRPRYTYIAHIRCGRYDYQWLGTAKEAYAEIF